jgi:hypothetical protein
VKTHVHRWIPFLSSIYNFVQDREYEAAKERISQGWNAPDDIMRVADYDRMKERDQELGTRVKAPPGRR